MVGFDSCHSVNTVDCGIRVQAFVGVGKSRLTACGGMVVDCVGRNWESVPLCDTDRGR